jgi:hypothetical protein
MRRSRKPFRAVSSDEGSNPSPSALTTQTRSPCGFAPIGNADPPVHRSPWKSTDSSAYRRATGERDRASRHPRGVGPGTFSAGLPDDLDRVSEQESEPPDGRSRPCLLAAEITDGEDENPDEWRQQRSDQVIASATTASVRCGFAKPVWPRLLAASSINSSLMSRRRGRSPPPPCVIGRYLERA